MGRKEALEKYPMPAFRHDLDPFRSEGGESQAAIRARVLHALEPVWNGGGQHVLLVMHGGFGSSLLRELLGMQRGWFAFGDTAFATLRLSRDSHTAYVTGANLTPHLPLP